MKCTKCGRDVPYEAYKCENCGEEIVNVAKPSVGDSPYSNVPRWVSDRDVPTRMSDEPSKGMVFTAVVGILCIFLAIYLMGFVYLEMAEDDPSVAVNNLDKVDLATDLCKYSQLGMFIFATLSILSLGLEVFPSKHG